MRHNGPCPAEGILGKDQTPPGGVTLREARGLRDEARALLTKATNPRVHREQKRTAVRLADVNTFEAVYRKWLKHRGVSLKEGRQTTLSIPPRILLFRYALLIVPGLEQNPTSDLDVAALPLPPINHNPFPRMAELPKLLQRLRGYRGRRQTQLGPRPLLLTGVRTGELRQAMPDQSDPDRRPWIIPPDFVKQLQLDMRKKRQQPKDSSPYIVAAVYSGHGDRPAPAG